MGADLLDLIIMNSIIHKQPLCKAFHTVEDSPFACLIVSFSLVTGSCAFGSRSRMHLEQGLDLILTYDASISYNLSVPQNFMIVLENYK